MPKKSPRVKPSTAKPGLSLLGQGPSRPKRQLEAFPNSHPQRDTEITLRCTEFTCLCPITGQPDFATLEICYIPDRLILESKSLKLYLWTYRDVGIFHENLVNELVNALSVFLKPRRLRVTGHFNVRGGIAIDVTAEYHPRRRP
ncbi:MAG: NADPH-dependent 7-cyano-7-deazaguanine reductase QueF [candidate division Zixibacteria bacterium]|nr:NADPH-dependent 7-cyano-7-deazaguanine reductase QueF [candidate division Zixibacteria bacterium]